MQKRKPRQKHKGWKSAAVTAMLRAAKTSVNYNHGMGGLPKEGNKRPKPITLPKLPWTK